MHRNHLVPCMIMLGAAVLIALAWGVQLGSLAILGVAFAVPAGDAAHDAFYGRHPTRR